MSNIAFVVTERLVDLPSVAAAAREVLSLAGVSAVVRDPSAGEICIDLPDTSDLSLTPDRWIVTEDDIQGFASVLPPSARAGTSFPAIAMEHPLPGGHEAEWIFHIVQNGLAEKLGGWMADEAVEGIWRPSPAPTLAQWKALVPAGVRGPLRRL